MLHGQPRFTARSESLLSTFSSKPSFRASRFLSVCRCFTRCVDLISTKAETQGETTSSLRKLPERRAGTVHEISDVQSTSREHFLGRSKAHLMSVVAYSLPDPHEAQLVKDETTRTRFTLFGLKDVVDMLLQRYNVIYVVQLCFYNNHQQPAFFLACLILFPASLTEVVLRQLPEHPRCGFR